MQLKELSTRIQQLIDQSTSLLATRKTNQFGGDSVDSGTFAGLRASVLSFISMVYGTEHSHYTEYNNRVDDNYEYKAKQGHAILLAIQNEIEGGWVFNIKKLISAEIFSDFLEMAEHLLKNNYKDPAAVMIGSVLEENLRQLCSSNEIDIEIEKDGVFKPKKADRLNSDLAKAEIYTKLDQKSVTMWLDLRNKAAHGKYDEYSKEQVELMLQGAIEFLTRVGQ